MKDAKDLIPWKVTDLPLRPFEDYWSFNNSVHFDGEIWRCVLRCCDYAMPDGKTIRSKGARSVGQQTKNAMVILDPTSWRPIQIYKMHERDGLPRASTPHVGYEDMRLFKTDKGGLQGIAASLHLKREARAVDGMLPHQPPEQVLLSFDDNYDIVDAHPIRGEKFSGTAQKNWVPFDHCAEPRFLYSIDKGLMFDDRGALLGDDAQVRPSTSARPISLSLVVPRDPAPLPETAPREVAPLPEAAREDRHARSKQPDRKKMRRGGRLVLDTQVSRPSARPSSRPSSRSSSRTVTDASTRVMSGGRTLVPKYAGLRGGSQLVRVGDDAWLGIGHAMMFVNHKKYYWHVFYLVDSRGKMTAASESIKLAPNGIEFAAGMAIDGDRVVISFGVDDMECKLGETSLAAVLEQLKPIAP